MRGNLGGAGGAGGVGGLFGPLDYRALRFDLGLCRGLLAGWVKAGAGRGARDGGRFARMMLSVGGGSAFLPAGKVGDIGVAQLRMKASWIKACLAVGTAKRKVWEE